MKPSLLTHGLIPIGSHCPFRVQCGEDCPANKEEGVSVDFSCGLARAYDIFGFNPLKVTAKNDEEAQ